MSEIWCPKCKKYTKHETVDIAPKGYPRTAGGCRDMPTDYRTVKCEECGHKATYDFTRD